MSGGAPIPGRVRSAASAEDDLSLVLAADLAEIARGQAALSHFLDGLDIDEAARNRVEVVFEELVSNVIRHGLTPASGQTLAVHARATPADIELTLEDDGVRFNPLEQAGPAPFGALEDARLGGLGIPLVLKLSASVVYEAQGRDAAGRGPVNRLVVRIARAP